MNKKKFLDHLTKDGRPDMRFAENRRKFLKYATNMDGSPDMRYKHNKLFHNASSELLFYIIMACICVLLKLAQNRRWLRQEVRTRMDGRPDMRFRENRIMLRREL